MCPCGTVKYMKTKTKQTILWTTIVLVIIGALVGFLVTQAKKPGKYDELAQCITDSGAKFYGAFWCPHCQAQKAMFGKSAKLLPYIECSQPSGQGQLEICANENIEGYPTWVFADGTRKTGEQSFENLALQTSCVIDGQ